MPRDAFVAPFTVLLAAAGALTCGGKASVLDEKFRDVNALIGNVKTALTGMYYTIKFAKNGYSDLAEM